MGTATQKTTLENGVRIISRTMRHMRSVSMGVWVNVGARDENPEDNGVCHFIEHMMFKGTEKRSAYKIAADMDAIGGQSNAFTTMEHTCFHGKVLGSHAERLSDLLSDIFLHSVFDPEEIQRERDVVLQELYMLEDTPEEYLHVMASEAFFGDHPLGRSILGMQENLNGFDRPAIVHYFNQWYQPKDIIVAAAGNLEHDVFTRMVAPAFSELSPGPGRNGRSAPRTLAGTQVHPKDLEQVHLCLMTPGVSAADPCRYASSILNACLGGNASSRLFQEIREKRGLAYSVYSFGASFADTGLLGVYAGVDPKNVEKTLDLILQELDRLRHASIPAQELASAKEYIKGCVLLATESTDSQMLRLAQNEDTFGRYVPLSEVVLKIDAVTAKDVQALAERCLIPGAMALALLGPVDSHKFDGILAQ